MINNHFLYKLHKSIFGLPSVKAARKNCSSISISLMRFFNGIQLSTNELTAICKALSGKSNPRFLVFGLGNDSLYWHNLNKNGITVFVEDNEFWIKHVGARIEGLDIVHFDYGTRQKD